jgi:hypothetical protein
VRGEKKEMNAKEKEVYSILVLFILLFSAFSAFSAVNLFERDIP